LHDRGYVPEPFGDLLRAVYEPLVWLAHLFPPLDRALREYVGLWEPLFPR
jgi:hypothetical protein